MSKSLNKHYEQKAYEHAGRQLGLDIVFEDDVLYQRRHSRVEHLKEVARQVRELQKNPFSKKHEGVMTGAVLDEIMVQEMEEALIDYGMEPGVNCELHELRDAAREAARRAFPDLRVD